MAVNRNFVVKNGLTVNTSLLFVDSATNRIGIGSTVPSTVLDVIGGIAATDLQLSGVSTISGAIYGDGGVAAVQIGSGISIAGITTLAGSGGITTTGGDFYVGGDLYVGDDVEFDSISGRELYVSGIGTVNQFQALTANVSGVINTFICYNYWSWYSSRIKRWYWWNSSLCCPRWYNTFRYCNYI